HCGEFLSARAWFTFLPPLCCRAPPNLVRVEEVGIRLRVDRVFGTMLDFGSRTPVLPAHYHRLFGLRLQWIRRGNEARSRWRGRRCPVPAAPLASRTSRG